MTTQTHDNVSGNDRWGKVGILWRKAARNGVYYRLFNLFPDFPPYQRAGFLQLVNIGKSVFGHEEKGTGVEIEVKEIRAFDKAAESRPGPCLGAVVRGQLHALVFEAHGEMVLESERFSINAGRQYAPDDQHEHKPQKGKDKERGRLYLLKGKQSRRSDGEDVDQNQQYFYLGPRQEMVA